MNEDRRIKAKGTDLEMALISKRPPKSKIKKDTRSICTFCNFPGHIDSKCYKKHPHLNVNQRSKSAKGPSKAYIAKEDYRNDDEKEIALIAKDPSND